MSILGASIGVADNIINVPGGLSFGSLPAPFTIGSENILVTSGGSGLPFYSVNRGENGTAPASHVAGTTVTAGWGGAGTTPTLVQVLAQGADAGGDAITGLADPSGAQDAATKAYVDSVAPPVPTLAQVLSAGNLVPAGTPIKSVSAGADVELSGADGGTGASASSAILQGGNGDDGNGNGAIITAGGSDGTGIGGDVELEPGAGEGGSGKQAGDVVVTLHAGDGGGRHGQLIINGLPTADPHVVNALYVTAGVLHISAG